MSARYSAAQVTKAVRDAQTSLTNFDVAHRPRSSPEWHDATVRRMRLALAAVIRDARSLRAGAVKRRRAA